MGKDESEMVALKEEPGYGGTDAEESKIDISDFKPAAPTWVLDGTLRANWTLAAVGFYFQYTQMFSPPFVVEILLWPLQTIEYGLLYAVASTSAPAAA